nr:unnamed protein product [Callosobruchus analis]
MRNQVNGDLILTVQGAGEANVLKNDIVSKLTQVDPRTRKSEATFLIMDIAPAVTEREVSQVTFDKIRKKNIEKHVIKNDLDTFGELLKWKTGLGKTTSDCVRILKEAYIDSQTRARKTLRRPYWWNDDVDAQIVICIKKRRLLVISNRRNRDGTANEHLRREYSCSKKRLSSLIVQSKKQHWEQLCLNLNDDVWGNGYRSVVNRLINQAPLPATGNMKSGTAPGVDGIPPEAIKEAVKVAPKWMSSCEPK